MSPRSLATSGRSTSTNPTSSAPASRQMPRSSFASSVGGGPDATPAARSRNLFTLGCSESCAIRLTSQTEGQAISLSLRSGGQVVCDSPTNHGLQRGFINLIGLSEVDSSCALGVETSVEESL